MKSRILGLVLLTLASCRFDSAGVAPETGSPIDASAPGDAPSSDAPSSDALSSDALSSDAEPCSPEVTIVGLTGDARSVAPDHTPTIAWQAVPGCTTSFDIAVGTSPAMDDVVPFTSLTSVLNPSVTTSYRIVDGTDGFALDLYSQVPDYYITVRADGGTGATLATSEPFQIRPVPRQVSEPAAWLDSTDLASLFQDTGCSTPVTVDGQPVTCWANLGAGANAIAEQDALRYLGPGQGLVANNDHMVISELFAGTLDDVSVWLVQREDAAANSFDINLNHPDTSGVGRYSAHIPWGSPHRVYWDVSDSRIRTAPDVVDVGETHIVGLVNSASLGQRSIHVDGAERASGAASVSASASDFCFGLSAESTLFEILVIAPTPSLQDIEHLEGYLACKWDLRDQLAPSHPYHHSTGSDDTGCP